MKATFMADFTHMRQEIYQNNGYTTSFTHHEVVDKFPMADHIVFALKIHDLTDLMKAKEYQINGQHVYETLKTTNVHFNLTLDTPKAVYD